MPAYAYNDTLTITDASSAGTYNGPVDAQDGGAEFRHAGSRITSEGGAVCYLPPGADMSDIDAGDFGTLTYQGGPTYTVTVTRVRRLDDALEVRYD